MSYEGYSQFLCHRGHYWTEGCMLADIEMTLCPICGGKATWENMVNTTNGSHRINPATGKPERIDGFVKLKVKEARKCPTCNQLVETLYEKPKGGKK